MKLQQVTQKLYNTGGKNFTSDEKKKARVIKQQAKLYNSNITRKFR